MNIMFIKMYFRISVGLGNAKMTLTPTNVNVRLAGQVEIVRSTSMNVILIPVKMEENAKME